MGKAGEIMGAKVFLKIESALQIQGVVILAVIIIMSRTVLPEQKKRGPEARRAEKFQSSKGGLGSSH